VERGRAAQSRLGHFLRGCGITVLEGYGMTETSPATNSNTPDAQTIGTAGRPIPGCTIRIADDGEVLVKGHMAFQGYWNNPAATKEMIDQDGWLHTGDLGVLDDEGFLAITGRKKDLIITASGKNVAPAVLEDRLRVHWLISQCLIVGDGKPYVGGASGDRPGDVRPVEGRQWQAADGGHGRPSPRPCFACGDPGGHRRCQQGSIAGRGYQEVRDPRRGLHRGGRPADTHAEVAPATSSWSSTRPRSPPCTTTAPPSSTLPGSHEPAASRWRAMDTRRAQITRSTNPGTESV
jgi:hypothetical protein